MNLVYRVCTPCKHECFRIWQTPVSILMVMVIVFKLKNVFVLLNVTCSTAVSSSPRAGVNLRVCEITGRQTVMTSAFSGDGRLLRGQRDLYDS